MSNYSIEMINWVYVATQKLQLPNADVAHVFGIRVAEIPLVVEQWRRERRLPDFDEDGEMFLRWVYRKLIETAHQRPGVRALRVTLAAIDGLAELDSLL